MTVEVLREVRLYGALGRQFGRVHRLAVLTPAEAVQALCAVLPGFQRAFVGPLGKPLARYHVFVGRGRQREAIGVDEILDPVGTLEPIRVVPMIEGAKRAGTLQVIIGAAFVVAGFYFGSAELVKLGAAMVLGGVVQLLSPQRPQNNDPKPDNLASYGFDSGPVNTTQQGLPVPLVFGRVICGSAVISQGLSVDDIAIAAPVVPMPPQDLPPYEPIDAGTPGDAPGVGDAPGDDGGNPNGSGDW